MSMGNYANYADVIQEGAIGKLVQKEWDALLQAVINSGEDWEDIARDLGSEDTDKDSAVYKAYVSLQKAFLDKTGLELAVDCRYETEGVDDGAYWFVDGMYELTPAGKKMQRYVDREMWTTFG